MNIRKYAAIAAVVGCGLLGQAAWAYPQWKPVFQSGKVNGVLTPGAGQTPINFWYDMAVEPVAYSPIYAASGKVYNALYTAWNNAVYAQAHPYEEYRSHQATATGPVIVSYDPAAPAGTPKVHITVPTLNATVNTRGHKNGVWADCTLTVSSGPLTITADDLNLATGALVNPVTHSTPTNNTDCSSMSWFPIVGDIASRLATSHASGMFSVTEVDFSNAVQSILPANVFSGIPSLPAGKFMVGPVDYGAYVTNNLPLLLSGGFDLTLSQENLPAVYGTVTEQRLLLAFKGPAAGFRFNLYETAFYRREWVCDPGVPCQQP
jgi:hypothetical protein